MISQRGLTVCWGFSQVELAEKRDSSAVALRAMAGFRCGGDAIELARPASHVSERGWRTKGNRTVTRGSDYPRKVAKCRLISYQSALGVIHSGGVRAVNNR